MGILEGKVAVITGSSRGYGLAIARAYAREGTAVVLSSRSAAAVASAVEGLQQVGFSADGMACDVGDRGAVEALARRAEAAFGRVDIWINNAAIAGPYGPTVGIQPEAFETVIRTNINGVYNGSLAAMDIFLRQGHGKLINMVGRGASGPEPFQNAYASSKAWVLWFTKALAAETRGRGVDVLILNPGLMLTDLLTDIEVVEGFEQKVQPLETIMRMWANTPEAAAAKAVYLASPATDGQSGKVYKVMTTGWMIQGALRELGRKMFGPKESSIQLKVRSVPVRSLDE
jgi:glucose 1-dehydrogenase